MFTTRRDFIKKGSILTAGLALTPTTIFSQNAFSQPKFNPIELSYINNDITQWDALTLSDNIKKKVVSCHEVMTAYLNKISVLNPKVNAIVSMQEPDLLLKQAQKYDELLSQGVYLGWMHGFPHAIKDLSVTKGIATTYGSPMFKDLIPDSDGIMAEQLSP